MKFSLLKMAPLMVLGFLLALSCQNDESYSGESSETTIQYKSIDEVLMQINNPDILALFNDRRSRIINDDVDKSMFEVIALEDYTNYSICLSEPTIDEAFYTFLIITIDNHDEEKAALVKYSGGYKYSL